MWIFDQNRPIMPSIASFVAMTVVLFVSTGLVSLSSAQTATVQSGTTTFTGLSTDVSITSVELTKSFLVFSYTVDDEGPSQFQVRGDLTTSTNIHFERSNDAVSANLGSTGWMDRNKDSRRFR